MSIIIAHISRLRELFASRLLPAGGQWVYFGEDWHDSRRVAAGVPATAWRELDYRRELNNLAAAQQAGYVDFIAALGTQLPAELWLVSSIAEKNATATLFLDLCRALWARDTFAAGVGRAENILLVCARDGLLEVLATLLPAAVCYRQKAWRRVAVAAARFALARWHWLREKIALRRQAGSGPLPPPPAVIMRSWIDSRSFDEQGNYHDVYFGGALEQARRTGEPVALLPCFLTPAAVRPLLRASRAMGFPLVLYERLVPLPARLLLFLRGFRARLPRFTRHEFAGLDCSPLLNEAAAADWCANRYVLYHEETLLVRAWKRNGWSPRRLIFPMENQPWERVLISEMRRQFPQCTLVGYQHTIVSPQYLFYLPGRAEMDYMPQPDLIFTVGEHTRAFLRQQAYRGRIEIGGAWRFAALLARARRRETASPPLTVLVVLPINPRVAGEMAARILELPELPAGCAMIVKPHPCTALPLAVRQALSARRGVTVTAVAVAELLQRADVLVYSESTVALEALAAGVPVVSYVPAYVIDIDPLAGHDDLREQVTDLRDVFVRVRCWPAASSALIADYFTPPSAALAARMVHG